jgi:hypothetical protein
MGRLVEIENDLALRQGALEKAAWDWYRAKRDKEHDRAVAFIRAIGTVAERNATAELETCMIGRDSEAEYESLRAVLRVLETRASIGQSILRAQSRV